MYKVLPIRKKVIKRCRVLLFESCPITGALFLVITMPAAITLNPITFDRSLNQKRLRIC